jgi:Protein of unknown function (DUF2931)
MKAKPLITLHIAIIGFLFSTLGYANMFNFGKNKSRFDWVAQASAPKGYIMRIIEGTFYYHDEEGGLYIPEGASVGNKDPWGDASHSHNVGEQYKALPDRLDIRFFSFTENKLYRGSFDLPYDKILALFKEGAKGSRYGKDQPGYRSITAGIAPGGAVAVWVKGVSGTREVFFGQAEEYEDDLHATAGYLLVGKDRDDYVKRYINDMPSQIQEQVKTNTIPFGIWAKYRSRYRFVPVFKIPLFHKYYSYTFFSGENWDEPYPITDEATQAKPVPKAIIHQYVLENGKPSRGFGVLFDFEEINDALKKLSQENELVYIEIDPKSKEGVDHVRLYNSKESVWLKKNKIKQ